MTERTIVVDDIRVRGTGHVHAPERPQEPRASDPPRPDCLTQVSAWRTAFIFTLYNLLT
jgi:hypothetical protein